MTCETSSSSYDDTCSHQRILGGGGDGVYGIRLDDVVSESRIENDPQRIHLHKVYVFSFVATSERDKAIQQANYYLSIPVQRNVHDHETIWTGLCVTGRLGTIGMQQWDAFCSFLVT